MRFPVVRLILLCCALLTLVLPFRAQDSPAVSITPEAGPAEQAIFEIKISGLKPESPYLVEILFRADVVFSSDEMSNADGQIDYPIISTEGDAPGIYTLQVVSDGEVIASADFELTEAAADDTEAEVDFLGDVTVTPETAPFGKVQTIRIDELEAGTKYTLEITASETLQVAYRRIHTSDDDGAIEIEVFAEADDSPGRHAIAVYDEGGELIAEGEFIIEAPAERAVLVELQPYIIQAGQAVDIVVSGLSAFDGVTAQITSADGVLINTILARASIDGDLTVTFNAADDLAAGDYAVDLFVEADKLGGRRLRGRHS